MNVKRLVAIVAFSVVAISCAATSRNVKSKSEPDGVLKVTSLENGCFEIERKSRASGLRIPRQVVCPVAIQAGESGQEPGR
jgi:hypothetical protein